MTAPLTPTGNQPDWAAKAAEGPHRPFMRCMPYCAVRLGQGLMGQDFTDFVQELDSGGDEEQLKGIAERAFNSPEWEQVIQQRVSEVQADLTSTTVRPDQTLTRNGRGIKILQRQKSAIQKAVHAIGTKYHQELPFGQIFKVLQDNGVAAIMDPAEWANRFVRETAECGSEEANSQHGNFEIAIENAGRWAPANLFLAVVWCVMPSGNYEIVAYVS